jgi:hypothetical protein
LLVPRQCVQAPHASPYASPKLKDKAGLLEPTMDDSSHDMLRSRKPAAGSTARDDGHACARTPRRALAGRCRVGDLYTLEYGGALRYASRRPARRPYYVQELARRPPCCAEHALSRPASYRPSQNTQASSS